jgi:hypothetical protein
VDQTTAKNGKAGAVVDDALLTPLCPSKWLWPIPDAAAIDWLSRVQSMLSRYSLAFSSGMPQGSMK